MKPLWRVFVDSEMFVDSFYNLYEEGILKRRVYDDYYLQTLLNEKRITRSIDQNMIRDLYEIGAR